MRLKGEVEASPKLSDMIEPVAEFGRSDGAAGRPGIGKQADREADGGLRIYAEIAAAMITDSRQSLIVWEGGRRRSGELAGNRTQDPRIKSALLYRLSYELLNTCLT